MENEFKELENEIDQLIGEEFHRFTSAEIEKRHDKLEELSKTVPVRVVTYP